SVFSAGLSDFCSVFFSAFLSLASVLEASAAGVGGFSAPAPQEAGGNARRERQRRRGQTLRRRRRSCGSCRLQGWGRTSRDRQSGGRRSKRYALLSFMRQTCEFPVNGSEVHAAVRRALFREWCNSPHSTHMDGACRSPTLALSTRTAAVPQGDPVSKHQDVDPVETREWVDAIDSVISNEGVDRARFLLESLIGRMRQAGADLPFSATT